MPTVAGTPIKEAGVLAAAFDRVREGLRDRATLLFLFTAGVLLFTYFEVYHHYWFLKLVGGYVVTDRMLQMFRKKPAPAKASTEKAEG